MNFVSVTRKGRLKAFALACSQQFATQSHLIASPMRELNDTKRLWKTNNSDFMVNSQAHVKNLCKIHKLIIKEKKRKNNWEKKN